MSRMRRQAAAFFALFSVFLLTSVVLPLAASAASTGPKAQADPAVGPMTRDEATHAGQVLHFSRNTSPIPRLQARRAPAPLAAGAAAAATGGSPQREIMGFAPYWGISQNANWNYSLLTTVAYFGLGIRSNGTLNEADQGWSGWNSTDLATVIRNAHNAGDRVVAVIKPSPGAGETTASTVNSIVTSSANTQQAINNAIFLMNGPQNIDGINVDFEGSSLNYPQAQSGFTSFMTQLSQQVHATFPGASITVDTYSGSASWDGGIFKIGDLAPVVDYMFVMAYDMSFGNMPAGGAQAGPNAPLNGWTYNDTTSVNQYLSKAPAQRVVLGVPYYGYKWCTVDASPYSAATRDSRNNVVCPNGGGTPTAATYSETLTDFGCALQLQKNWDATAQSPWASWNSPASNDPCGGNFGSTRELYYDDATSLGMKYDLVNNNNLRGAGMWALGYDGGSQDLWNELQVKFFLPLTSGADASSWGPGRLDVFAKGPDNALWHKYYAGGWSSWSSLGGQLTSEPAAVSWGKGRIDVFARGTNNDLQHIFYDAAGGGWSTWYSHGGALASGPDVASWSAGRLDVFARGTANDLQHIFYSSGTGWTTWFSHGGTLTSDPGAVAWGYGRIDVFAKGTANDLQHIFYASSSGWSQWVSHGGTLASGPDPSSWGPGRLDVFAEDGTNALQHIYYDSSLGGWSTWYSHGGSLTSDPGAVSWGPGRIDVFARGTDNSLQHLVYSGGWSGWYRQ
jgi:spore germination protein YaaH